MIDEGDGLWCPGCGDALAQVEAQLFRLECAACHGVWLDGSSTEQVVRGAISVIDDEEAAREREGVRSPYRGSARMVVEGRSCPFCEAALKLVTVPELGVQVDVCPHHGTWFDVTELRAVVEHYGSKRARRDDVLAMLVEQARRPSARARRWHPFW